MCILRSFIYGRNTSLKVLGLIIDVHGITKHETHGRHADYLGNMLDRQMVMLNRDLRTSGLKILLKLKSED